MPASAPRLGLVGIFISTFFALVGYFMLVPFLLLRLKSADVSTAVAGAFAAMAWFGVFVTTPFASAVTRKLGRRNTLWLSAAIPVASSVGFALTQNLTIWFLLMLADGMASGLRWVLAEAVVAEFSADGRRGRNVGLFETMVGVTFIVGPAVLAWVGPTGDAALWIAIGVMVVGLATTALIPPLPAAADAHSAKVGTHGVWHALVAQPVIMLAGFVGGFFESGITSILPLFGLTLGLGAAAAALLVSASGLGSAMMMLPAGLLADRWRDPAHGRRQMMVVFAAVNLAATCVLPFVAHVGWLAWPIAFLWGGAGGCLYTLAMIDIGSREEGITLVNSTAVLVLTYTLGGMIASGASGALLQWSPTLGFPVLLAVVALMGAIALLRTRKRHDI